MFNVAQNLLMPQWGQQAGENIRRNRIEAEQANQRNMLAQALPQALAGDQNALAIVAQADPGTYAQLEGQRYNREQTAAKLAEETADKRQKTFFRKVAGGLTQLGSVDPAQRPDAYNAFRTGLVSEFGPEDSDDLPEAYDEAALRGIAGELVSLDKRYEPALRGWLPVEPPKASEAPSSVREYEYAKSQGYKGSFQDFQLEQKRAGASTVTTYGGLTPGVDAQGNPVFVQGSNRGGAQIVDGVRPPPNSAAGQPTQDERQSALLLQRLRRAQADIETVLKENPAVARPDVVGSVVGGALGDTAKNFANPKDRQRIEAAQDDALDAALTLATGAAYTKEQLAMQRRAHFPQLGDSPQTAAEKNKRFADLVKDAELRSGRATPELLERPSNDVPADIADILKKHGKK